MELVRSTRRRQRRQRLRAVPGLPSLCTRHRAGAERTNPTCYCLPPVCVCVFSVKYRHAWTVLRQTEGFVVFRLNFTVKFGGASAAPRGRSPGRGRRADAVWEHPPRHLSGEETGLAGRLTQLIHCKNEKRWENYKHVSVYISHLWGSDDFNLYSKCQRWAVWF